MREFVTLPNAVTSGNLAAGFLALLVAPRSLLLATLLVVLAVVFDVLDGLIARRTNRDGAFGTNLDSLADLVSFGAVPALALYVGLLHTLPVLGFLGCLAFLLCGAWRLARFPLVKSSRGFVGLPIPPAAVAVMLLVLWGPAPLVALLVTAALGALMVSTVPFPTLAAIGSGASSARRHSTRRLRARRTSGLRRRVGERRRPGRVAARWRTHRNRARRLPESH